MSETMETMEQEPRTLICSRCNGSKWEPANIPTKPCFKCEGTGTIQLAPCGCWWSKPPNVKGFGTIHIECQDHYENWLPHG